MSEHAHHNTNPYLEGAFAPVSEEITSFDLPVLGELPDELNGRYLRNGPNPFAEVDPGRHHWFVGAGMVHGVRLCEGKALWYRNRYVGSKELSRRRGRPDIPGPNWNDSAGGPNTSVTAFAGKTLAMVEAGGCPVALTDELETVGRHDFAGSLPGAFTAHPKVDPGTGEMHAMAYAWPQWLDHVQYILVGQDGRVRRTVDIPLPGMTMMHDMALTQKYVVILDQPVTVDLELAATHPFPFRWNPDYGNRVGLLPRDGAAGDILWLDAPLGYCFHPMNAYDREDGAVCIDLCIYDRMFDRHLNGPFGDSLPRLERWLLNPATRTLSTNRVDDRPNEFPRHNPALATRPYRYGYCVSPDPTGCWKTLKHDLHTGATREFDHGPGRAAGEAVFVARAGATAEDDGYLLAFVHDLNGRSTELVVMDARDFTGYLARIRLPQRVPFGFHGDWVSDGAP